MFPRAGARSVGVLTPMFGITWLIGVFAVNDTTSVFQWLFVILNSLQGLMIFIVKCQLDKKVQDAFNEKRRRLFYVESSTSEENTKNKKTNYKITWMQMRSRWARRGNSSKESPRAETSGGDLSAAYVSDGTTCEVEMRY
ncbi:adhesion G-protein coupled receptor D1-like [Dreissena polymorpha]|uniref:adhesion G-protein coupled receptor D1-like n=1 Tax=Dreissena polymorpha TaxID=45954 RepID=UPI002265620F|nr:adhesion G-protein coupled receptor D1-like [Dreissena polymorpha]